jgi:hypothetical protein
MELIVVVGGTLLATFVDVDTRWSVSLVGSIPRGLPVPTLPHFPLIQSLLLDGFAIAMVSYSASVSMALITANKLNYDVDFNQELLAMVKYFNMKIEIPNQVNNFTGLWKPCGLIFCLYAFLSLSIKIFDPATSRRKNANG